MRDFLRFARRDALQGSIKENRGPESVAVRGRKCPAAENGIHECTILPLKAGFLLDLFHLHVGSIEGGQCLQAIVEMRGPSLLFHLDAELRHRGGGRCVADGDRGHGSAGEPECGSKRIGQPGIRMAGRSSNQGGPSWMHLPLRSTRSPRGDSRRDVNQRCGKAGICHEIRCRRKLALDPPGWR